MKVLPGKKYQLTIEKTFIKRLPASHHQITLIKSNLISSKVIITNDLTILWNDTKSKSRNMA